LKIVVLSIAGTAGKTTLAKHIQPLIAGAARISIEDWNSTDGLSDLEISAKSFYALAAQLNTDDEQSFIIDIGTSNSKVMLQHLADLELTRERIDFWIVPVRAGSKERIDTLKTIDLLIKMGVEPCTIVVIAMAITDVDTFRQDFEPLMSAASRNGFIFADQAVLFNDVYNMLKGTDQTVFDIVRNKPDFKKLRAESRGDEQKLFALGQQMLIYSLSVTATRNLVSVFNSTPISSALEVLT
jgi:hypothetical protein